MTVKFCEGHDGSSKNTTVSFVMKYYDCAIFWGGFLGNRTCLSHNNPALQRHLPEDVFIAMVITDHNAHTPTANQILFFTAPQIWKDIFLLSTHHISEYFSFILHHCHYHHLLINKYFCFNPSLRITQRPFKVTKVSRINLIFFQTSPVISPYSCLWE